MLGHNEVDFARRRCAGEVIYILISGVVRRRSSSITTFSSRQPRFSDAKSIMTVSHNAGVDYVGFLRTQAFGGWKENLLTGNIREGLGEIIDIFTYGFGCAYAKCFR